MKSIELFGRYKFDVSISSVLFYGLEALLHHIFDECTLLSIT